MNDILITTPIYYANGEPHIGHAYTSIASDVFARHHRLKNNNIIFSTGTDEHGIKIQRAAEEKNVSPQQLVDSLSISFKNLTTSLNLSNDVFIRTTEQSHKDIVIEIWNRLYDNGYIYLDGYSGWYSVADEAYINEEDTIVKNEKRYTINDDLVEWFEQESYFFAYTKIKEKLFKFYEDNPDFIQSESQRKQIFNIAQNQKDISISRTTFDWGISVPGDSKHVIYVWLDALTNYLTVCNWPNENYKSYWDNSYHIIGKDISKFHAIYWPAFLLAANITPPHRIHIHGWWTNNGTKMGKRYRNAVDPIEVVNRTDIDSFRYFLLRAMPFGNDGDYSEKQMATLCNAGLANGIGNLCQRTLTLIYNNYGSIPNYTWLMPELDIICDETYAKVIHYNDTCQFQQALESIGSLCSEMDKLLNKEAPWLLVKSNLVIHDSHAKTVLYNVADTIKKIAILLLPYIPTKANQILDQLNVNVSCRDYKNYNTLLETNKIDKPTPIFKIL